MLVNLQSLVPYVALWISKRLISSEFTQINNYDSLLFEIKFPVQSGANVEEVARNRLDSGGLDG
jgi:hypothetical protein